MVFDPAEAVVKVDSTTIDVNLDSVYRQIRAGDPVIVATSGVVQSGVINRVEERLVEIKLPPIGDTGVSATRVPVTFIRVSGVGYESLPARADFSFHFSFVDGGRATTVAETELTPQQLTNSLLPVAGNVERPPPA